MVWIYGASGHGKVILDILEINGNEVAGFIDDNEQLTRFLDYPVIRRSELGNGKLDVIIGIGANATRTKVAVANLFNYVNAIHPSAIVSPRVIIGEGNVVMAGVIVQSGTTIGNHVIVNTGARVDHDCRIDDYVHLSPGVVLCGDVTVGKGTWIGAGSTVIQGVTIGANVIVGAGSVIRKNVPDNVLIVGNPPVIKRKI